MAPLIRVALYMGKWTDPQALPLMLFERDSHVHAEVWVDDMGFSAFCNGHAPCVLNLERPAAGRPVPSAEASEWDVFPLPLTDEARAVDIMREMRRTRAVYSLNVRDFLLPQRAVNAWDPDVDCTKPREWQTLFCSQFALLYLRRCVTEGLLRDPERVLWSMNSRSCAPSHLAGLMRRLLSAQLRPVPPGRAHAPTAVCAAAARGGSDADRAASQSLSSRWTGLSMRT